LNTPFGEVKPNMQVIDALVQETPTLVDTDVLEYEHSVAGIMPYIKQYSPDANVIPLILSNTLTADELDHLASKIEPFITKNTVVLAPVDFSHYLRSEEAEAHDKVTWEAIQNFDIDHLLHMNSDNLDSPSSIALLLILMKREATISMHLYENTNSGRLLNTPYVSTTSTFQLALLNKYNP
jgi:AmmeMemoRadiSam system protein B